MLDWLIHALGDPSLGGGAAFVFGVLLLCGFGLPIPEDIILITGGVVAWLASPVERATFQSMATDHRFWAMVGAGLAGIIAGDSIIFAVGRRLGSRLAEHPFLRRLLSAEKMGQVETLMRRRGVWVVVLARYLPGLRAPTYFTVGHARLPYWEFFLFDAAAALVSAPLWVGIGYYFGDDIDMAARTASRFSHYLLAAVLAIVAALILRWWWPRRGRAKRASIPP